MIVIQLVFELVLSVTAWRKRWKISTAFFPFYFALVGTLLFQMLEEMTASPLHNTFSGYLHLFHMATILTLGYMSLRRPRRAESRSRN